MTKLNQLVETKKKGLYFVRDSHCHQVLASSHMTVRHITRNRGMCQKNLYRGTSVGRAR